jgi:hypothetical protein
MRWATVLVALVLIGLGGLFTVALGVPWASNAGSASASAGLACSVRDTDCGVGEVKVFRMSSLANAHAETPGGSTYGKVVCCGGVTGLGDSCSGTYDTVLTLSGTNNAHVASDASYATKACLSVGAGTVDCTYGDTCGAGYACLATISGSTNAHVADCNGTDDYTTKVCCAVTAGGAPVGGVAQLPDASGPSGPNYLALAGLAAALLVALSAGGWYARRRWLR